VPFSEQQPHFLETFLDFGLIAVLFWTL